MWDYTQTKTDSSSCIYIFEHTHTHTTIIITEEEGISLRVGGPQMELEGRNLGGIGGRSGGMINVYKMFVF